MMSGMLKTISGEVRRNMARKALHSTDHIYTAKPMRDPVDKRRTLTPHIAKFGDQTYSIVYCTKCGVAKMNPILAREA